MKHIILAGRTDVEEFFRLSGIFDHDKLPHTPFLAFLTSADGTTIHIVDSISALLLLPDDTPVMCQWRGNWSSDYFQFTVSQVRQFAETKSAPLKTARNVIKVVGPQGGFRSLSYEYVDDTGINRYTSTNFKAEAEKLESFFWQHNIPVETSRRP